MMEELVLVGRRSVSVGCIEGWFILGLIWTHWPSTGPTEPTGQTGHTGQTRTHQDTRTTRTSEPPRLYALFAEVWF